ncbi:MAG: hypothetical protein A3G49_02320 [Candidatus Sungbacteria bacterium RIFCSPLOWO2_12_FULL_41_11]|uniref:Uncharacterized protein n=1 Tax=Candidatus Sungbacteria bacterium RIFCSPLOWO2_12_FULL_41_11 TaxID=1802286 RepID=A0A1G2LNJ0_9BACT|nr:MAG: hypothetical protein A3D41_00180 [Candidatus Sungbacteria bacterium RIFCSPHIGHO2_02_FULL_41_12b]OHA13176.1 MAG: hypothetical protein A3G49_02320 [Candidatus Sungbacteria bacterium RIFCSPLOWO2_12_FULL_41_11]
MHQNLIFGKLTDFFVGGAKRRHRNGLEICNSSDFGVSLRFGSNSFYPKFLKTDWRPRFARRIRNF